MLIKPRDAPQWLKETVRYYRQLGFFAQSAALSDEQIAARIAEEAQATPEQIVSSGKLRDLWVVAHDKSRVWWEDGEGDIDPADNRYACTVQEWANISRGAFQPASIQEFWDNPAPACFNQGLMRVTFDLNGERQFLQPVPAYGWIDFDLLNQINVLIQPTGYAYEQYAAFDQTTFVVVLTAAEKHKLRRERKWRFA